MDNMGFIRDPKGIDFVIDSGVLSDNDREEIRKSLIYWLNLFFRYQKLQPVMQIHFCHSAVDIQKQQIH
jgi:hypothetical protein